MLGPTGVCTGVLARDGIDDGGDFLSLPGYWGFSQVADINRDGEANGEDLAILLGNWGICQ